MEKVFPAGLLREVPEPGSAMGFNTLTGFEVNQAPSQPEILVLHLEADPAVRGGQKGPVLSFALSPATARQVSRALRAAVKDYLNRRPPPEEPETRG